MKPQRTARQLLTDLGIGNFNATMIIQFMFVAPATTDPKSPPIIVLVKHIQDALNRLGANIQRTGYLDVPTAAALTSLVGPGWESKSWADNVAVILDAMRSGIRIGAAMPSRSMSGTGLRAAPTTSIGDAFNFLPDVPGGMLTYAAAAVGLYYWMKKRKKGAAS